jgi:hypothetical protein
MPLRKFACMAIKQKSMLLMMGFVKMPVSCTNARLRITAQANFCLAKQVNF